MFNRIKEYFLLHTEYGKSRYLNYLLKYDLKRYNNFSSLNSSGTYAAATEIRILSHTIEKAMSLPNCRAGFGKAKIIRMIELFEKNKELLENTDTQISSIVYATIQSYAKFQKNSGIDTSFIDSRYLSEQQSEYKVGVVNIQKKQLTDFEMIANQRKSARYFGEGTVSKELVRNAVKIAQTAPSACNRQPIRIYACLNEEVIKQVMSIHRGVAGFGRPGVIFAITGDLRLYQNELERDTVFVDGGLFAMNLLYALDSFGMVSCPAIWGSEPDNDRKMASLLGIPLNEVIVLLVFSGKCPDNGFRSAISSKREIDDILHII